MKWTLYIRTHWQCPQTTPGSRNYYGEFKEEEIGTGKIRNLPRSHWLLARARSPLRAKAEIVVYGLILPYAFWTQKERPRLRGPSSWLNLTDSLPGAKCLPPTGVPEPKERGKSGPALFSEVLSGKWVTLVRGGSSSLAWPWRGPGPTPSHAKTAGRRPPTSEHLKVALHSQLPRGCGQNIYSRLPVDMALCNLETALLCTHRGSCFITLIKSWREERPREVKVSFRDCPGIWSGDSNGRLLTFQRIFLCKIPRDACALMGMWYLKHAVLGSEVVGRNGGRKDWALGTWPSGWG